MYNYAVLKNDVSWQETVLSAGTIVEVLDNTYKGWKIRHNSTVVDEVTTEALYFFDNNKILPAAMAKKLSEQRHKDRVCGLVNPITETLLLNIIKAISRGACTACVKKTIVYKHDIDVVNVVAEEVKDRFTKMGYKVSTDYDDKRIPVLTINVTW